MPALAKASKFVGFGVTSGHFTKPFAILIVRFGSKADIEAT